MADLTSSCLLLSLLLPSPPLPSPPAFSSPFSSSLLTSLHSTHKSIHNLHLIIHIVQIHPEVQMMPLLNIDLEGLINRGGCELDPSVLVFHINNIGLLEFMFPKR